MPDSARLPPALTVAWPLASSTRARALASARLMSRPLAVTVPTKSLAGSASVTLPLPLARVVLPPTRSGPVCVMSPPLLLRKSPLTVVGPKVVRPPLVVARLAALPATVRSPPASSVARPLASMTALRPLAAASVMSRPLAVTVPAK